MINKYFDILRGKCRYLLNYRIPLDRTNDSIVPIAMRSRRFPARRFAVSYRIVSLRAASVLATLFVLLINRVPVTIFSIRVYFFCCFVLDSVTRLASYSRLLAKTIANSAFVGPSDASPLDFRPTSRDCPTEFLQNRTPLCRLSSVEATRSWKFYNFRRKRIANVYSADFRFQNTVRWCGVYTRIATQVLA